MGSVLLILLLRGLPPAHLIFKGWCGFLADQLHWPSRERITPALCFGFAVDGGGRLFESVFCHLRGIPKKCHCCQAGAATKGKLPDAGDVVTNRDARQAAAGAEGPIPNAGDPFTYRDARQALAAIEGISPDAGNAIRNGDTR